MSEQPQDGILTASDLQEAANVAARESLRAFLTRLQSGTQSQEDLDVAKEIMAWWSQRPRALAWSTRFREASEVTVFMNDMELAGHLVAIADHLQGDISPTLIELVGRTLLNARIQDIP